MYHITQHFGGMKTELKMNLDGLKINPIGFASDASAHGLWTKFYIKDGELWASCMSELVETIHDFMEFILRPSR